MPIKEREYFVEIKLHEEIAQFIHYNCMANLQCNNRL
jgi:hypothetical protein